MTPLLPGPDGGLLVREHLVTVPVDHAVPNGPLGSLDVFVREIVPASKDADDLPCLLYLQGGPGFPAGRPTAPPTGWTKAALSKGFRVFLLDQRGTGLSQPSVRDDYRHMATYADISLAQMSADFEAVRESLGIERWLVFGGSWGSTLGLDYAIRQPDRCLGLILRGIFLNTKEEFEAIYCRKSFAGNARRLAEFDTFFELAAAEATRRGEAFEDCPRLAE